MRGECVSWRKKCDQFD